MTEEGACMNRFMKCFVRFAIVVCAITALALIAVAALLLFAPKLFMTVVYYSLVSICAIGAIYLIICLLRILFEHLILSRGGNKNEV